MENHLFQIRESLLKGKRQGWIEETSFPEINRVLYEKQDANIKELMHLFHTRGALSLGQIQLLEVQLEKYRNEAKHKAIKMRLFSLENLYKSFKTPEGAFYALKGVSLTIFQGEILAILGFSGSGKSTFLNVLGLLSTADENSHIMYNGTNYHTLENKDRDALRKKDFGFIFQESHLLNHLSALENVALPLRLQNVSNKQCMKRAEFMLTRFMTKSELENTKRFFRKRPSQFSGGQKQRIAAARAMVHNPKVIFADEPTGSLDFDTGQQVMDALFESAREDKVTVIFVTHNHSQARQYCERFIWMEGGEFKSQVSGAPETTMRLVRQLTGKELNKRKK